VTDGGAGGAATGAPAVDPGAGAVDPGAGAPAVDPATTMPDPDFVDYVGDDFTSFDRIDDKPWYSVLMTIKYVLNIIFIALPWATFGCVNIAWNVWLNIQMN